MEGDICNSIWSGFVVISIHSLRMEGDACVEIGIKEVKYFNPLPPHGGRPVFPDRIINHFHFNPLPPHGGRRLHKRTVRGILSISIHSLRMEGDSNLTLIFQFLVLFQSTPSAWRETDVPELVELPHPAFQSTPSAWRETTKTSNKPCRYEFQSTPSAWRETPA